MAFGSLRDRFLSIKSAFYIKSSTVYCSRLVDEFPLVPLQNPESQNLEHLKSRHTQNLEKNIKAQNNYFKQSQYRAKGGPEITKTKEK
jgi:hypothetical protein